MAVALQLLHGDIEQLRREYMVLFTRGVSITRKLGFSDIIMPGRASVGGGIYGPQRKNLRKTGVSVMKKGGVSVMKLSLGACRWRHSLLMLLRIF